MKYLGSSPNRLMFLLILLVAMVISATDGGPLFMLQQQIANYFAPAEHALEATEHLPA